MRVRGVDDGPRHRAIMAGDVAIDTRSRRVVPDDWLALAVFLTLAALYVATLLPGLGGTEDTPKFQYIGAALGTPHDPGYPFYILLSYLFSKLPVGTLAYRSNLLSAVCGAATGALVFLALRRLSVHRWLAVATAFGLGVGRTFWEHSVFAEVYTPAAALMAATLLALLEWESSRRLAWLYAAIALACLGFGAHLIVLGAVPAFVLFVLATFDWRPPLRVLAVSALLVTAGVAQYGYVWVRSIQGAEYLEATVYSVSDFADLLVARQFQGITFADSPWVLLTHRVPSVAREMRHELGWVAVVCALAGCAVLLRRRPRAGMLLALAAIGSVLLLSTLGEVAIGPILLPGVVSAWLLAGAGLEALRVGLARLAPAWLALAVAGCVATAIPTMHVVGNVTFNNHRHDTYHDDYFRTLFERLPPRAGFIDEEYVLNNMVAYQRYATDARDVRMTVPPGLESVAPLLTEGFSLFAFERGRAALEGLVTFRPEAPLIGSSLDERCRRLAPGSVLVLAGSAPRWPEAAAIGLSGSNVPRGRAIVVAVAGAGPPVVRRADGDARVHIFPQERLGIGDYATPVGIDVELTGSLTRILVDGELVWASEGGIAVVELAKRFEAAYTLRSEHRWQAPIDMRPLPLFTALALNPSGRCTDIIGGRWTRLSDPGRDARLVARVSRPDPAPARWQLYFASATPLAVRVGESYEGDARIVRADRFDRQPASRSALLARLLVDGITDTGPLLEGTHITRVEMETTGGGPRRFLRLELGGQATAAVGRVVLTPQGGGQARLCGVSGERLRTRTDGDETAIPFGPDGEWFFGPGWSDANQIPSGFERLTLAPESTLLLTLDGERPSRIEMRIDPVYDRGGARLIVNGEPVAWRPAAQPTRHATWDVPPRAWTSGLNTVTLQANDPTQRFRVRRIALDWSGAKSLPE